MRKESLSGKDIADARAQRLVERADAERAKLDGLGIAPPELLGQPKRHLVASRQECGHWLRIEAGQSEPQHRQRRCVEPLDVVDREQEPLRQRACKC